MAMKKAYLFISLIVLGVLSGCQSALDTNSSTDTASGTTQTKLSDLPAVKISDWELILVNREHITPELNPELATIENIEVDSRIADNTRAFLEAARQLDPNFHLISGYRSVATQETLYQSYVDQELAADPGLGKVEAEKKVQTYSQPAGASEHQTGLAVDISTIDALNQADSEKMNQLANLAVDYGFVRRFEADKTPSTGIGFEDWHFRYVGKLSARYMMKHHLSLEEYIEQLEEKE